MNDLEYPFSHCDHNWYKLDFRGKFKGTAMSITPAISWKCISHVLYGFMYMIDSQ